MLGAYLIGIVTAPLVGKIVKPVVRAVVRTTVEVATEVRKTAHEMGAGLQEMAAEVVSTTPVEPAPQRGGHGHGCGCG